MPFVIPTAVGAEGLVLDGLNLSQGEGGAIRLKGFVPPIPKKNPEWIEAADGDGAILARDPRVSNGQAQVTVTIYGVSRDDAQTTIGTIVDKLEEADRNPAGIPLVWTPGGSTPHLTFYVLSGEVTEFPVDWESGYMVASPELSFTLDCAPYGYGTPVVYTGSATAGPLVTLNFADVPGDAPAEVEGTVTDSATQSRRTVEWGAEQRYFNPASPWSLVLDSDSLVTSGFAGTQTTLAGAYDPGASGNSIIQVVMAPSAQAVCGTGAQLHVGTFRVKARINSGPSGGTAYFRFAWRAGDGDYTTNDPVLVSESTQLFKEIDLGLITIPPASAGTQTWDGRVEAWSANAETMYVDYLLLFPVEAGYGKATASYTYSPGVITGRDSFTGTTAAANLNGRTADAGGTWASGTPAPDFIFADPAGAITSETISRGSNVSAGYALLGAGTPSNAQVDVDFLFAGLPLTTGEFRSGAILRWTDASNYLRATFILARAASSVLTYTLVITQVVAGVETVLATTSTGATLTNVWYTLRAIAFSSGRVIASVAGTATVVGGLISSGALASVDATSSALAGGGALATGKSGIYDLNSTSGTGTKNYDNFVASTPPAEPIILYSGRSLKIGHDNVQRESSSGGTWGRPQSYRGSRFYAQPAGVADRTTRWVVKASRSDLASAEDANLTDQITLTATVTPRYMVVPRP